MRSVEEQQSIVTAAAVAPRPVRIAISESQGLLCAEDVVTEHPMPGFDQAAIDGYAVRAVDVAQAGTFAPDDESDPEAGAGERIVVVLPVVGEIPSGSKHPTRLLPQQTVKVETGAPMPTLADAVIPAKWTDGGHAKIRVGHAVRSGDYVRKIGNDVRSGDVAVRKGSIIGAPQVGLLAAVGRDKVLVHPRPRLSVISVGDELVDIDRIPGTGQVFDVTSYALAAAARDAGADVNRVGIVGTDPSTLRDAIETQLIRAEIVLVCGPMGGRVSRAIVDGVRDLGDLSIDRIAMHPGSVQGFGLLGRDEVPTFFVPSNPMSALVVFEVMVRPLIRIALGKRNPMRRSVTARTISPINSVEGRKGFIRGQLMRDEATDEFLVQPLGDSPSGVSHLLSTLAEANCLIVVDRDVAGIDTGDEVDVIFLANRG